MTINEVVKKVAVFFGGTVDELKKYKGDKVFGTCFALEVGFGLWGYSDFRSGEINYLTLPFTADLLARGCYSVVSFFHDGKGFISNYMNPKKDEGLFSPGIIGIARQKFCYKTLIDDDS